MIRISKITDPNDLINLVPHFTHTGGDVQEYLTQLVNTMNVAPDNVQIFQAISGTSEKDDELVGFTIAQNPGPQSSYLVLGQVWIKPGTTFKLGDELLARLALWGVAIGKSSIRGHTSRDPDALFRRYGFEDIGSVVERRIDNGIFHSLVEKTKEAL